MAKKTVVKIGDLNEFGNKLAASIRSSLRAVSKRFSGSGFVRLGKVRKKNAVIGLDIEIGGEGFKDKSGNPIEGALYAVEYGSNQKKHKIKPRNADALAFFWPKANVKALEASIFRTDKKRKKRPKYLGKTPDGRLMFRYVDHPGMAAMSPISKALVRTQVRAKDELLGKIKGNVTDMLNFSIREINRRKKRR